MKVTVIEIVERLDGTKGLGNSEEMDVNDAIMLVETGKYKSETHSIGVVPEEWLSE